MTGFSGLRKVSGYKSHSLRGTREVTGVQGTVLVLTPSALCVSQWGYVSVRILVPRIRARRVSISCCLSCPWSQVREVGGFSNPTTPLTLTQPLCPRRAWLYFSIPTAQNSSGLLHPVTSHTPHSQDGRWAGHLPSKAQKATVPGGPSALTYLVASGRGWGVHQPHLSGPPSFLHLGFLLCVPHPFISSGVSCAQSH